MCIHQELDLACLLVLMWQAKRGQCRRARVIDCRFREIQTVTSLENDRRQERTPAARNAVVMAFSNNLTRPGELMQET